MIFYCPELSLAPAENLRKGRLVGFLGRLFPGRRSLWRISLVNRRFVIGSGFCIHSRCDSCWHRRHLFVRVHRKALAFEHRCHAGSIMGHHRGTDFGRRCGIIDRTGHQAKLHAEPVAVFPDHDHRTQVGKRRVRPRFEQPAPECTQAGDRVCTPDIDSEFSSLNGELWRCRSLIVVRHFLGGRCESHHVRYWCGRNDLRRRDRFDQLSGCCIGRPHHGFRGRERGGWRNCGRRGRH